MTGRPPHVQRWSAAQLVQLKDLQRELGGDCTLLQLAREFGCMQSDVDLALWTLLSHTPEEAAARLAPWA